MNNLDYLNAKVKDLSMMRKDAINSYIVGAASVVIVDEKKWQEIVDNAVSFFDMSHQEKVEAFENDSVGSAGDIR